MIQYALIIYSGHIFNQIKHIWNKIVHVCIYVYLIALKNSIQAIFLLLFRERERWLFERESDLYLSFIYNRPFLHLCLFLCTYYIGHLLTCIQTRERKERRKKERQIERESEIFRQTEYYCRKKPFIFIQAIECNRNCSHSWILV